MYKERNYGEYTTHDTRAYSNDLLKREIKYIQILDCLKEYPMTAKQVAVKMMDKGYIPTSERNFTAPRLTEMSYKGIVEPIGKIKCEYTGRMVSVYKIRESK